MVPTNMMPAYVFRGLLLILLCRSSAHTCTTLNWRSCSLKANMWKSAPIVLSHECDIPLCWIAVKQVSLHGTHSCVCSCLHQWHVRTCSPPSLLAMSCGSQMFLMSGTGELFMHLQVLSLNQFGLWGEFVLMFIKYVVSGNSRDELVCACAFLEI